MTTDSATNPNAAFPFAAPASASADGPGTVVNPERRGSDASVPIPVDSSVLRRLFPREEEGDVSHPQGVRLEHFEVLGRLGRGGMSGVFLAMDTRLERHVALKVLAPDQSRMPDAVRRFRTEARAAARLDHPNIVRAQYVGDVDGVHFIAYEYVDGPNVRDVIRERGRLPVREAVNYAIQLALALQHASAREVVHRDIKPSNIVVTPDGRAKLVDLGLARLPSAPGDDDLTIAGTTLGTFDYVSPEQATDPRRVDVRSDIYSLGCTLYHMLVGEPPYAEGTMLKKLLDHERRDPPDPAKHNRSVPSSLSSLCRRMMASQPRKRPPTAEALLQELSAVAAELGMHATHPEGFVWGVPRRESTFLANHLGWMTTVGLLLLIVVFLDRIPSAGGSSAAPGAVDQPDGPPAVARRDPDGTEDGDGREPRRPATDVAPRDDEPTEDDPPVEPRRGSNPDSTGSSGEGPGIKPTELVDPPDDDKGTRTDGDGERNGDSTPPTPVPPIRDPEPPPRSDGSDAERVFVIVPTEVDVPPDTFKSLAAAVSAADDGGVIELAYDGERLERPLRVSGKHLVIRAAAGFTPTIRFGHDEQDADDDTLRMITVTNGSVDLINLDVVLDVDRFLPVFGDDRWALLSLVGSQRTEVRNTTVTVRNSGARPVAVVELREAKGRPLMPATMMKPTDPDGSRAAVRFANAFVRGHADLIAVDRTKPARIDLEQSLFTLEGGLLDVRGTAATSAGENDFVDLTATHVTGLVGHGLVRFDAGDLPRFLPALHVTANNNLFATRTETPLVVTTGLDDLQDFRDLLTWSGGTNFYDGFVVFQSLPGDEDETKLDFEAWRRRWNATTDRGSVAWATTPPLSGYDELGPTSVSLDAEVASNPAIGGATDDTDVGAELTRVGVPGR